MWNYGFHNKPCPSPTGEMLPPVVKATVAENNYKLPFNGSLRTLVQFRSHKDLINSDVSIIILVIRVMLANGSLIIE